MTSFMAKRTDVREVSLDSDVIDFLMSLSGDYPDITRWLHSVVEPGLSDGTRKVIVERRDGRVAAVGIAKNNVFERKICTVRVANEYAGKGVGVRLFTELMEWLETDMPYLTVSEGKLSEFQRIFDYFGFKCTSIHMGRYNAGSAEYLFNEPKSFTC